MIEMVKIVGHTLMALVMLVVLGPIALVVVVGALADIVAQP